MRLGSFLRDSALAAAALALCLLGSQAAVAQQAALGNATEIDDLGFRKMAAGVEYTFPADIQVSEKVSRQNLIDILNKDKEFGVRPWSANIAENVRLESNIWALEFTTKPCRMIWVDVPAANGKFDRKLIWYMWYHVKNVSDQPVTFTPQFVLHAKDVDKYYSDRLVPVAMEPIAAREDSKRKIHDSVSISEVEIAPAGQSGDEVWGCCCWEDIDPTTDEFAVFVRGLTNAYKMEAVANPDGEGLKWEYFYKTLQINFRRPGDEFHEHSSEVRLGDSEGVEYRWVYN